MEVQRLTTPLSRSDMARALMAGHRGYFGSLPSAERLCVGWAQCALEHAAGEKLYNFNLGNVTCGPAWSGDFYVMKVPPPDPPVLRFRAFGSAELGAEDYWGMLAGHYRPALRLFDEGNAYAAALLLGELGYYTAKKEVYAKACRNWADWFARELAASFSGALSEGRGNSVLTEEEIAQVLASQIPLVIDDPILDDARDQPTDPSLSTIPEAGGDESEPA